MINSYGLIKSTIIVTNCNCMVDWLANIRMTVREENLMANMNERDFIFVWQTLSREVWFTAYNLMYVCISV